MIQIQVLLIGFMTFAGIVLVSVLVTNSRAVVRRRLAAIARIRGVSTAMDVEVMSLPFSARVFKPFLEKTGRLIGRLTPKTVQITVGERLVQAGHPGRLQTNTFLAVAGLCVGVLAVLTILFGWAVQLPVRNLVGLTLICVVAGFFGPWFWLARKAAERIRAIDTALPDAIDLLVVSVEAGLAFDMALAKVTEKTTGPLADEFARALNEIRLGKMRKQALKDLADRVGSKTLAGFVTTIVQSTQMGVTLGDILRIQSEQMRQERRMRASEAAMKAPVKMLFPMVFFIFPALFVVLLGPAVIRMMQAFRNM